jgi:hypothetical protein
MQLKTHHSSKRNYIHITGTHPMTSTHQRHIQGLPKQMELRLLLPPLGPELPKIDACISCTAGTIVAIAF